MKNRTILSCLTVIFFAVLGGASFDSNGGIAFWAWILIILIIIIPIFGMINGRMARKEEEKRVKQEEEQRQIQAKRQAEVYKNWFHKYVETNGQPDKTIVIIKNDINQVIHVHEADKSIYMQGKFYRFENIIKCTFTDNPTTIKGKMTAITKSDAGSTIGRAIVGDMIGGSAGAIIGGVTATKTTDFHQENDTTIHDYTVNVNINSITTPIVSIKTGSNINLTNEIVCLMNVIISRNDA